MTNITSIVCQPGTHTIQLSEMEAFLHEWIDDDAFLRKFKFLVKDNSVLTKRAFIPDYNVPPNLRQLFKHNEGLPSTATRMSLFKELIIPICKSTVQKAINKAGLKNRDITHIIAVSCTGLMAPGIETLLVYELGLDENIDRHAINFMGCYAAFHAFRLARLITTQDKNANVLMVCGEICSLHFRDDPSDDNILATYLFSDGVAACIISSKPVLSGRSLSLLTTGSTLVNAGVMDMGWYVGNFGFEMILNKNIPKHINLHMKSAYDKLLELNGLSNRDISHFAIHPGGKNILQAFKDSLGIEDEMLANSNNVLRHFGNMSSATILFVLENYLNKSKINTSGEYIYTAAFGPGLSIEHGILQIQDND